MHSITRQRDVYSVVRLETGISNMGTVHIVVFNKLSFDSAMKLVNFLNGGGAQFTPEQTKVLAMCQPSE